MSKKTTKKSKKEESIEEVDPFPKTIFFEDEPPNITRIKGTKPTKTDIKTKMIQMLKQEKKDKKESEESEEEPNIEEFKDDGLTKIRKENLFKEELTEDEKSIITKRLELQKQKFERLQKKREKKILDKIRNIHNFLTDEEIQVALEECDKDEDKVILSFTDPYFVKAMREHIAKKYEKENPIPVITHTRKKKTAAKKKQEETTKRTKKTRGKGYVYKRLKLDEAIAQGNFEGWSPARIRAYNMIKTNPNAYYYRFNHPDEAQKHGKWSESEKKLFLERLKTNGANKNWGIFAMAIPGRVGYQCSNFYRQLIQSGEIKDPNYVLGENGKAKFIFGKGKKASMEGKPEVVENPTKKKRTRATTTTKKTTTKKKRKKDSEEDDDDDDDGDEDFKPSNYERTTYKKRVTRSSSNNEITDEIDNNPRVSKRELERLEREESKKKGNPLPGFIDPITLDEVVDPMISPHGHVMSRESWLRCLTREDGKNICPLTKKTLNRRELVALTWENIEEYKPKIANI